ncbi:MAG TPA: CoA transferase, partial [Thermoanaerobaculia bacterium]|nr:CoA transferase [Thermoanaerobaculia bacterium]
RVGEPLPLSGALPCYGVYRTADGGWLAVATLEPHFFRRFCAVAGRPELARLQYRRSPRAHRKVAALVASRSRAEWETLLAREDLPVAPVLSAAEARAQPQMQARGLVEDGPDGLPRLGFPTLFDGERPRSGTVPPPLGAATEAILEELGMAADLPRRKQRAAGIGVRFSWRDWLRRWLG